MACKGNNGYSSIRDIYATDIIMQHFLTQKIIEGKGIFIELESFFILVILTLSGLYTNPKQNKPRQNPPAKVSFRGPSLVVFAWLSH